MNGSILACQNSCNDSELPLLLTELLPAELSDVLSQIQAASGGLVNISAVTDLLESITKGVTSALSPTQQSERAMKGTPAANR